MVSAGPAITHTDCLDVRRQRKNHEERINAATEVVKNQLERYGLTVMRCRSKDFCITVTRPRRGRPSLLIVTAVPDWEKDILKPRWSEEADKDAAVIKAIIESITL